MFKYICTVNVHDGENYGNGNSIMWMTDVVLVAILMVVLMWYGVVIVVIYNGDDYNDSSHDYFDIIKFIIGFDILDFK